MPVTIGGSGPITGVTSINTTVTDTELGYLDGVTSALQTQINAKANDSSQGLYLITPTSIANSGGSASASGGAVTFTTVNSVSLNGVFTSTYANYLVLIKYTASADGNLNARLRLSGTDASGATDYTYQFLEAQGTTITAGRSSTSSALLVGGGTGSANSVHVVVFDPGAAATTGFATTALNDNSGGIRVNQITNKHSLTTAYDGISLIPASGTITGTVRVYGYKN